jgi:hypothetical protein
MASIIDEMKRWARDYAQHAHTKIARLDNELADIEKKKSQINAERDKARGALKRAADFPVKRGADYLCPLCWVDDDVASTLRSVGSPDNRDIFRCNRCHFEGAF